MTVASNFKIAMLSDWLKNLPQVFQSMRCKMKTNRMLQVIARHSDWFIALFTPVVIGWSTYFGLGFWTII